MGEPAATATPTVTVHRWTTVSRVFTGAVVVLVIALALVPYGFGPDTTEKLTELFVLIILATMWNVLAGYGGMVSVGQQAFIGFGAYATIVLSEHSINPYIATLLAALIAGALSIPVSLLVFRLRGGQFAIGMWVIAEVLRLLVTNNQSVGGGTGRSLTQLNVYEPATRQANTYWVALAFTAILLLVSFLLLRTRLGASLQAIRDDEVAARSVGVRVTRAKRYVFLLAAIGCGAAGAITVANSLRIQPDSIFGVQWTAYMIFMVLLGGLGTFEGPVLGALVLFGIQQEFQDQGSWYLVGLGAVAIVVTLLAPRGVWGVISDRFGIRLLPVGYHLRGLPGLKRRRGGSDRGPGAPGPLSDESAGAPI